MTRDLALLPNHMQTKTDRPGMGLRPRYIARQPRPGEERTTYRQFIRCVLAVQMDCDENSSPVFGLAFGRERPNRAGARRAEGEGNTTGAYPPPPPPKRGPPPPGGGERAAGARRLVAPPSLTPPARPPGGAHAPAAPP